MLKSKIKKISSFIIILLSGIIFSISLYIKNIYSGADFEQIIYNVAYSDGTSMSPIIDGIKYCLPIIVVFVLILMIPFCSKKVVCLNIHLKRFQKNFALNLFPSLIYSILVFICILFYSLESLGVLTYLENQKKESEIFDKYYIDPNTVELNFPQNKKNLIYIYLESMESSYIDYNIEENHNNLIPKLSELAIKNVHFSNTNNLGGAKQVYGTTYTIASMVSQTAGIPLKTLLEANSYGTDGDFLPGVISLGDILQSNGYKQYILMGSNSAFAARDKYFSEHGSYELYDHEWAEEKKYIPDGYNVWWGYEDKKLFKIAKEELKNISKNEEPFNFTILTADTHANEGYLDEICEEVYEDNYANAILCSDSMVSDFISWILKQDFAKNTSVIITGDHLTMRLEMADYLSSDRTIFNAFINSSSYAENTTNRIFTLFDMFPTTLASLGVQISGERLGLGTNLFSDVPTYAEELGIDYMDDQLEKNSSYYNEIFLE